MRIFIFIISIIFSWGCVDSATSTEQPSNYNAYQLDLGRSNGDMDLDMDIESFDHNLEMTDATIDMADMTPEVSDMLVEIPDMIVDIPDMFVETPPNDLCQDNTCNDHGWCVASNGICECDPGYQGDLCEQCADGWSLDLGECRPNNRIMGTSDNDDITGTEEADFMQGLIGDDRLSGRDGDDYINGNQGDDYVNGNLGDDDVRGGSGADDLRGGAGRDVLTGGGGDDQLTGGGGIDRLIGGEGSDELYGAADNDRYMFDGLGDDMIEDDEGQMKPVVSHRFQLLVMRLLVMRESSLFQLVEL